MAALAHEDEVVERVGAAEASGLDVVDVESGFDGGDAAASALVAVAIADDASDGFPSGLAECYVRVVASYPTQVNNSHMSSGATRNPKTTAAAISIMTATSRSVTPRIESDERR